MSQTRWSAARAREWAAGQPWWVGCNFVPSSAINPLEMWQAETFDPEGLDRELGWAAGLGMNSVRVHLHDLAWEADPDGFAARLDRFLAIAARHGIRALLVVFDDCWHEPHAGPQPAPRPGVHNSGWVRSPGARRLRDRASWDRLETYVRTVLGAHAGDARVMGWDLYNEVTNYFLPAMSSPMPWRAVSLAAAFVRRHFASGDSMALLDEVFRWARAVDPMQPLTAGIWSPHGAPSTIGRCGAPSTSRVATAVDSRRTCRSSSASGSAAGTGASSTGRRRPSSRGRIRPAARGPSPGSTICCIPTARRIVRKRRRCCGARRDGRRRSGHFCLAVRFFRVVRNPRSQIDGHASSRLGTFHR